MKDSELEILLVDDHPLFRKGVRSLIEAKAGYRVIGEASNGCEAVTFTRANKPAVIFMDIDMPEMNGLEATRIIKKVYHRVTLNLMDKRFIRLPSRHTRCL